MSPAARTTGLCTVLLLAALLTDGGSQAADDSPGARATGWTPGDRWAGHGVCYGPHRDGQRPGGPSPTREQLREDLHLMAAHWRALRLYGSVEFAGPLLEIIRADALDLRVILGAWIAPDAPNANEAETAAAIALAAEFPDIVCAVSVGNETQVSWSPHPVPLADLIANVRKVRAAVQVPVAAADDFGYWITEQSRELAAEVDFVLMHAHPMWNGIQLDGAVDWLAAQVQAVGAVHPGLPVVVGETGWATSVHDEGEQSVLIKGAPGEAQQAVFIERMEAWSRRTGTTVFVFEAFDEKWKGGEHPAEVEKHWGLYNADRTPKAALAR